MFDNLIGLKAAKRQSTSGFSRYGEDIWDRMTTMQGVFTFDKVVDAFHSDHPDLSRSTCVLYCRAFFAYCKAVPEDFHGPKSRLVRGPFPTWYLEDSDGPL